MLDDNMISLSSSSVSSSSPFIPLQIPLIFTVDESFNLAIFLSSFGLKPHRIKPLLIFVFSVICGSNSLDKSLVKRVPVT